VWAESRRGRGEEERKVSLGGSCVHVLGGRLFHRLREDRIRPRGIAATVPCCHGRFTKRISSSDCPTASARARWRHPPSAVLPQQLAKNAIHALGPGDSLRCQITSPRRGRGRNTFRRQGKSYKVHGTMLTEPTRRKLSEYPSDQPGLLALGKKLAEFLGRLDRLSRALTRACEERQAWR